MSESISNLILFISVLKSVSATLTLCFSDWNSFIKVARCAIFTKSWWMRSSATSSAVLFAFRLRVVSMDCTASTTSAHLVDKSSMRSLRRVSLGMKIFEKASTKF